MKHACLIAAVSTINGASFIGIDTHTDVKLAGGQKNPHQGRVTKRMTGALCMAFTNQNINAYRAMVQRRLEKENKDPESFELGPRAWGTRVPNLPIVEHKDSYYLEVIFMKPGVVEYLLDGLVTPEADIQGLPARRVDADSQGGLEDKVIIRDFKAESITELRINGQSYR
jgi:hypothetical protein